MVFLKRSITVLLVATLLSLTSIVITPKASAQETGKDPLQKPSKEACHVTQILVMGEASCKKKPSAVTKLLPTNVLLPSPTPTETPKTPEKPISEPIYTPPAPVQTVPTATLSAEVLFNMANAHRAQIGLPAFEHDGGVCAVAESRREEIAQEIFVTHALHSGFYAKNLPYWATENMIWQNNETDAFNWWMNSSVHRSALEGNYKYACGVCNGQVCNMVFTSYDPKVIVEVPNTPTTAAASSTPAAEAAKKAETVVNSVKQATENKLSQNFLKVNP